MKPWSIPQPRKSPVLTSHQLKPVASTSQRREYQSLLPFPAAQVFPNCGNWAIRVTREDHSVVNEGQDAVVRFLRRVDRNSRERIEYANDRMIPVTASEDKAARFAWYEDELINIFQKAFDDVGKDNYIVGFVCVWMYFISTFIDTKIEIK
ncbi:hypothetical protein O181_013429 [Austropuccinia psidii MF-1]|uniref:Uncharacterized protein n=1 Tax=Austropuccinia psidii MF-1 TaxID=1389203 RepID=A0A9Q3BWD9_9BASI|nr:hypothetical protein [Austropuccinia psidii MF-1]